jgi:hypothetical protein
MNIVQLQEQLKNFSQDQLVREMQMPSGTAPQFLVLGEIMRRQKMQQDFVAQQGKGQPQATVAQEAVAAAGVPQGGIADMARALAPNTDMGQNTGVMAMAKGGPVKKMAAGDKVVLAGKLLTEQEDGTYRDEQGRVVRTALEDLSNFFSGVTALPQTAGEALGSYSADIAGDMNAELLRQSRENQGQRAFGMRAGPDTSYQYPPVPTVDVSAMDRVALALEGRSGFPTGMPTREEEAIAARNELLSGLVSRFDQQALQDELMSSGGGRSGPMTGGNRAATSSRGPITGDVRQGIAAMADADMVALGLAPSGATELQNPRVRAALAAAEAGPLPIDPRIAAAEGALRGQLIEMGIPTGEVDMEAEAKRSAEEAAAERDAAGITRSRETPFGSKEDAGGGGADGGGAGGGGAGGAGAASPYEQELMNMLASREKAAQQDKWLALAQVGLNMMASTSPTLLGAIGEAGVKGVEAVRSARDQYDQDRLSLLGQLEQSRQARAAAANRGQSGGLSARDLLMAERYARQDAVDLLETLYGRAASLAPGGVPMPETQDAYDQTMSRIAAVEQQIYGEGTEEVDPYSGGTYDLRN